MDILSLLADGVWASVQPINLLLSLFGVFAGLWIGAMPGLGSVNGVAILLPFTFVIQDFTGGATAPMIFLAAIYFGAMYGGAISSITLGIPGASTAVATVFDGRPLALKGLPERALVTAAMASFIGGTVANVLFTAFAPPLASVALDFGSPEIFALMLVAFSTFIGLGGDDLAKTLVSIFLGFILASIGTDAGGDPRLVFFGHPGFLKGIDFLIIAIGVYGIGEMLWTINTSRDALPVSRTRLGLGTIARETWEFRRAWRGTAIGSSLGFFVGILPAAGATPASLMAYGTAKMTARDPSSFGKGNVDGISAPESANNSASCGAMLPMITLGIPGSPTTAVLLAGLILWGLQPGPLLFKEHPEFVWPLIGSFYVSNFAGLVMNLALIPLFLWMLRMPFTILAASIFVLSTVGTYAATTASFDLWLMLGFGVAAFFLRILDYPLAPCVLALVLGPIVEPALSRSLQFSDGDPSIFFTRPIAGPIMIIAIVLILLPVLRRGWQLLRQAPAGG